MATTVLTLDGDGTTTGWARVPASGTFASKVEDIASSDDDTTYIESPNAVDGIIWLTLTNVPADFDPDAINSITIRVQHRRLNTPQMAVDSAEVTALLVRTDELTDISTTPTAVVTPIQGSYAQTNFAPSATGSHSVADWNAAKLEIQFDHINAQTPDTVNQMRVTAAEVEVDYTPAGADDQEAAARFYGVSIVRGHQLVNLAGMIPPCFEEP